MPEDAGFVSDEMADASVESLKTWVQDVIVDSKVCPFTPLQPVCRSGAVEVAAIEPRWRGTNGVKKGPIMYHVSGLRRRRQRRRGARSCLAGLLG